jgi:translocation and assembly module TamA
MVDEALTGALRASVRLAMRLLPILPAALCVAIGMPAATTWADTPVVIEGADEDAREAILDLLPGRDRPTTLFEAERIAEEAAARALVWLRSEGYYSATVTPEASDEPVAARLVIALGPRFSFAPARVAYSGEAPDGRTAAEVARALQTVEEDAPARAANVLEAEASAVAALQNAGYAQAAAGERRVVVDHATARVAAEFRLSAGAVARLGAVRAEPGDMLRPSFVARLRNWEEGELYSPQALSTLRRDFTSTGAVSLATTRLEPPGPDGLSDVVVEIELAIDHRVSHPAPVDSEAPDLAALQIPRLALEALLVIDELAFVADDAGVLVDGLCSKDAPPMQAGSSSADLRQH